jgi:hypothetical protein
MGGNFVAGGESFEFSLVHFFADVLNVQVAFCRPSAPLFPPNMTILPSPIETIEWPLRGIVPQDFTRSPHTFFQELVAG